MTSNTIPQRQNEEPHLNLMRARQWTYVIAQRYLVSQILLTILVPVIGAIWSILQPQVRPYFAAAALIVLLIDTLILDRECKSLTKKAAKIGEKFDCAVLGLPWNRFVVGEEPEAEDIREASREWSNRRDDSNLRDWYPVEVGKMPLGLARIVCQRTNLRYDAKLRRSFGKVIVGTAVVIALGLFATGLAQDLNFTSWILTFVPAMPLLSWAGREFYRQKDAADQLEELWKKATSFWNRALAEGCDEIACLQESREFQNAIYLRRATSPLVIPYLYNFKRLTLEDEMNDAAQNFLAQYEKQNGQGPSNNS